KSNAVAASSAAIRVIFFIMIYLQMKYEMIPSYYTPWRIYCFFFVVFRPIRLRFGAGLPFASGKNGALRGVPAERGRAQRSAPEGKGFSPLLYPAF
ncbi:MAG: hypothetical protein K2K67_02455, partial [Treponemataceae bacterium]|nr:hypothetical protein [Treponemataceae bacterium]